MCVNSEQNVTKNKGATPANLKIAEIGNIEATQIQPNKSEMAAKSAKSSNSTADWHTELLQIGKTANSADKDFESYNETKSATKLAK